MAYNYQSSKNPKKMKLKKMFDQNIPNHIQTKINYFIDSYNSSIIDIIDISDDAKFENSINDTSISVKQKYGKSTMKSVSDMEKYYKEILAWLSGLTNKELIFYAPKVEFLIQVKNVCKDLNILNISNNSNNSNKEKNVDKNDKDDKKEEKKNVKEVPQLQSAMKDCWDM